MQVKLSDGSIMVCGNCGQDPELKTVGEKNSRKCTVGLAVGKRHDDSTIWCNVVAWHDLAEVLAQAKKRTSVLVVGRLKSREYQGKTYTDLEAEYVSVAAPPVRTAMAAPDMPILEYPKPDNDFMSLDDTDPDLPF